MASSSGQPQLGFALQQHRPRSSVIAAASVAVLLAVLCWTCFFNGIHILYPLDKTEALQIALAHAMAASGDWVTPAIDGLPYFDKPPLPYWIGAWLLQMAPREFWLPRIGAACAGCVGVLATLALVHFGSSEGGPQRRLVRAVTAAGVLALTPAYFAFSRTAVHDIYLTACITTTLAGVFLISQAQCVTAKRQIWAGGLIGLSLGVGVLAKGLLSLALPLAVAGTFLAVAGHKARQPFTWRFGLALLLAMLLVALPWHLAAWQAQGSTFVDNYLIRTHVHRFATELDDHAGPWFYYLIVYPLLTAPWSLPAAAALIDADCLNPRRWYSQATNKPLLLFCTIWIGVTVLLLSLSWTKLPHYILSTLPPTSIAAAYFFWPAGARSSKSHVQSRLLLSLSTALFFVAAMVLAWTPGLLIPISQKTPGLSLALRTQLGSLPFIAELLLLAVGGFFAAWRGRQLQLCLGALWAAFILSFLLLQAPTLLQAYRHTVQDPRLAMASRALVEARPHEPIAVIGQAWYSIRLNSHDQIEILNRGKAFGEAGNAGAIRACSRPGLLLGPTKSVEKTVAGCGAGSFTLLYQDSAGRLSLTRWQPSRPTAPMIDAPLR